jgi:hypothetical protein
MILSEVSLSEEEVETYSLGGRAAKLHFGRKK